MIHLSENAIKEVRRRLDGKPGHFLRVSVKGGGCSGMSYDVKFDDKSREFDRQFEEGGVKVICDSKNLLYLDNMTVDFSDELVGGGFKFINPNATGSCGCGSSFSA